MPAKLPSEIKPVWEVPLFAKGLGGVAATKDYVIVSDREVMDTTDVFKCLRADDGKEVWAVRNPAISQFDFGNSSRATPLIEGGLVYLFGATGQLTCVELETGKTVWEMDVRDHFKVTDERKWGMCSSPLIVDGKLIINPGAEKASLVALDPRNGKEIWRTPGKPASYGSFMTGAFGGKLQLIGYDADSLGGWEVATGKRLWSLTPEVESKFNVNTPVQVGDKLLITLENNGTKLFQFNRDGTIDPQHVAYHRDLSPDSHTPVVVANRVWGVWNRLFCLDLGKNLKAAWESDDKAFGQYAAIVANETRILIISIEGELILLDAKANEFKPISRVNVFKDEAGLYSHPAFVGTKMYVRGSSSVICVDLGK